MTYTLRIVEPGQRQRSVTARGQTPVRAIREAHGIACTAAVGTCIDVLERRSWFRADRLVGKVERTL